MRLVKISSITLFLIFTFISCQDDPTSLGKDLVGDDLKILEINSQTDLLNQTSGSYNADSINYGFSSTVLLGNLDYLKSTLLLRFGQIIPDSIQNAIDSSKLTILSAEVDLFQTYTIGDTSNQFNFSVHEVTSNWKTNYFNGDSLSMLTYEPSEVTDNKEVTDSTITFNVNNDIAMKWLKAMAGDSTVNNYGLVFFPDAGSNLIYGFRGHSSIVYEDSPVLRYVLQFADNKIDTLYTYVLFDAHIPESKDPQIIDDNKIQLTAGIGKRGKLYFDLSKIPSYVNVNKAELTLYADSLSSQLGSPEADSLRIHLFADSTSNELSSKTSVARLRYKDYEFTGDITRLVQAIVNGVENQGFSLRLNNEIRSADNYIVYGSKYSDLSLRPKLIIYYNELN